MMINNKVLLIIIFCMEDLTYLPKRRSLNCQSFANFFINLMRGNPFRYTTFIKAHTVVERRLLVMKYLYEINVNF